MNSACDPCKKRHLKCDRARPVCGNCQKSRKTLTCQYRDTKFRQSILSILANSTGTSSARSGSEPSPDRSPEKSHTPISTSRFAEEQNISIPSSSSPHGVHIVTTPPFPGINSHWQQPSLSSSDIVLPDALQESPGQQREPATTNSSKQIHVTESESALFLYYIKHAGVWLDIVSPNQSFSLEVPKRALRNPLLYYSCLAYAAHVMCLQGRSDQATADHYHNKAISFLIPLLNPESMPTTAEEDLFPAIVILRMSEQFVEPDEDAQTHIYGAFSLLTSSTIKWPPDRVDMTGTAFWVFVRQTLRICFISEQPCPFDLDIVNSDNMFAPAADEVWVNRMTFLLTKTCNLCWSTSLHDSHFWEQELDALEADLNRWCQSLPDSFKPWYYHQVPSFPFPQIYCLAAWHGIAWQQYYTSKTMIAVYRHKQDTHKTYYETSRYWNSKILVPARLACAFVLCHPDIGSGINGAHLSYWCGQFLMGRTEQFELMNWLENFMNKTKWPNRTYIERLRKQWVMVPDTDLDRNSPPPV